MQALRETSDMLDKRTQHLDKQIEQTLLVWSPHAQHDAERVCRGWGDAEQCFKTQEVLFGVFTEEMALYRK